MLTCSDPFLLGRSRRLGRVPQLPRVDGDLEDGDQLQSGLAGVETFGGLRGRHRPFQDRKAGRHDQER